MGTRAVLATGIGAGVTVLAGCTGSHPKPAVDPDQAALDAARAGERTLLAAYADGTDGHTVHLAHLRALGATLTTPTPGAVVPAGGVRPEEATVQPLMAAARNARRGNTAALLASIAASHAVLAGVRPA